MGVYTAFAKAIGHTCAQNSVLFYDTKWHEYSKHPSEPKITFEYFKGLSADLEMKIDFVVRLYTGFTVYKKPQSQPYKV